MLSLVGAAVAILVATWGLQALLRYVPSGVPSSADPHIDRWALLFTVAVAIVTGLGFGLVPALHMVAGAPGGTLKDSGARTTGTAGQGRFRNALVVAEVALSLILVSGAGLMIRTVANLTQTDAGFDPRHELSAEIWVTGSRYDSTAAIAAYYRELTARLNALPGVTASAVVEAGLPLERGGNMAVLQNGERMKGPNDYRTITPDYFKALGVPMLQGRAFTADDDGGAPPVMVVTAKFAHQYLADSALGTMLTIGGNKIPRRVIGVVGDVKSFVGYPAQPTVFLPSAQTPVDFTKVFNGWFPIHVIVRTAGDPAAMVATVTRAIAQTDPSVPLGTVEPLTAVLRNSLELQRFLMVLLSVFAGLAMALALVGIYGLVSYVVAQGTRDIGIRIALGAVPGQVVYWVVGRGMRLAIIGALWSGCSARWR